MSTYRSVNSADDRDARRRIVDAACHLFAQRGFASTSVREIALAARVTKPMIYYYFGNKEGLFRSLRGWATEAVQERLRAAIDRPGTARQRLEWLAAAHPTLPADVVTLGGPLERLYGGVIGRVLIEGERRAESRPVDRALFLAAFCGLLGALDDPAKPIDLAVDILWRGVAST